jgi:predicted metal-dependent enzyme (double-stranded beta helix superfamily)
MHSGPQPSRALDSRELAELAGGYAADRDLWLPHVRVDAERRACHPLLRSPLATVWLLCWMPGQDTGFHDHDGAAGAVAVVAGRVLEERLQVGGEPLRQAHGAGTVFGFGSSVIHRVAHAEGWPAVTIHAYSPALRRMGAYTVEPSGELRRHALDEDVELRADAELAAPPVS